MKERIRTTVNGRLETRTPTHLPDPANMWPEDLEAQGLIIWVEPGGDRWMGHGAFIEGSNEKRYRLELNEGDVVRIVEEPSKDEIHLGSEMGGKIVSGYHGGWEEDTDSSDILFRKGGQLLTENVAAPIGAPSTEVADVPDVPKEEPVPPALVPEPWDIADNTATVREIPVEPVVVHTPVFVAEELVVEAQVEIEEEEAEEEAEQPSIIWIAPIGEESDHKRYRIERDEDSGNIVRVVEEVSGDTIPLTTKRVQNIISEAEETVWWTKFTNTSRLRFQRLHQLVSV